MNAIKKRNGELIRLSEYVYDENGNEYRWEDLTLVSQVDNIMLEQMRNEMAAKAQQALIQSTYTDREFNKIMVGRMTDRHMSLAGIIAMDAVTYADALVKELAKGKHFYTAFESDGATRIANERKRQIEKEGYDEEHDAQEPINRMVACAISYAMHDIDEQEADAWWSWDRQYFKPKDRMRNLERAGALIAAAIDKLLKEDMA